MSEVPHEVLSDHFQDRLADRRPLAALFLTYRFEPGFFEQEVLPILFDIPVGHGAPLRLLRLEEALSRMGGRMAVYYDQNGLDVGDMSAKLDVRRIPIRHPTGIFHPKVMLVLCEAADPDEEGHHVRSLLVGCLSANLTRAGWWENVEACHVEEVAEDDATRLRPDLLSLLDHLRRAAAAGTDQSALEEIVGFLRGTSARRKRSSGGVLHPHFYVGKGESVVDFLDRVAGDKLRGCYLEVISPYFDNASRCRPLEELVERFAPREVRVHLPRDEAGRALVNERLHGSVAAMERVSWGQLPESLTRLGRAADAGQRFVHAKIYRFFRQNPKLELLFVGSVNLTVAAHQVGGNFETAFLCEHEPPRRPEFWLIQETRTPTAFEHSNEAGEAAMRQGVPLVVRYSWLDGKAEAWWESKESSPALRLEANGVELAALDPLTPRAWTPLDAETAGRLGEVLSTTSFLTVLIRGKEPGLILVQEEGMSHKPSLLLTLSARDILQYWAMLSEEQRTEFLERRLGEALALGSDAQLTVLRHLDAMPDTMFDRFAGIFHAFGCLERTIAEQLERKNEREAEYRLFGRKHDSLGRLLERVLDSKDMDDDVSRFVVLLCAHQLRNEVARAWPEFWTGHRREVADLDARLARVAEVRARIEQRDPAGMTPFLAWFEPWFLRRANPVEVEA